MENVQENQELLTLPEHLSSTLVFMWFMLLNCLTIYPYYFGREAVVADLIVVGFTTTCVTSAYHHKCCEFEPCSW